ncbi:SCO family protein [Candidatus Viadribacter manganicus]|uniref:Thioredoxin domain-containing protein n=1 Tax=Candidatus Viadribacter manganicus TaxID=1759059 RepID=A0A1B1AGP3_9PROT|nr:SCO family protein [Candidatus Viadribacter manganicus]ANP45724.1 hypothetical protein ATE48_07230 [Candidatus Viadribacter manganicus]
MIDRRKMLGACLAGLGLGACGGQTSELSALGRGIDDVLLTSSGGEDLAWRSLRGRPRALFFGFTHCPEICPVTIYELTASAERLGPPGAALRIDFVTVDPERDTPERMASYFSGFGPNVTGFTGSEAALGRLRAAFDITATRTPLASGDYTMDHTATVFLLDRGAIVRDVIAYGSTQTLIDERLGSVIGA